MRIASTVAGLLAWISLFLPWWHISGLGSSITISPVLLLAIEKNGGAGANLLQPSEGFYGLVIVSFLFILMGGIVGTFRGYIKNRIVVMFSGLLLLSTMHTLTYTSST